MMLTRLEAEGVGPFVERIAIDLGRITLVKGRNAQGKTWTLRIIECLLGASGASAAALVSTDEKGVPLDGVVPEIVGFAEGDGERYKVTRRAKKLIVQRWEIPPGTDGTVGTWRSMEPPDQALARIFDRDSSPSALLDERLSEDKRIALVLEVADAAGYDRTSCLVHAFQNAGGIFTLQPIPAGLHPLEDLAKVQKQVFDARTDVERQRKAAASAADRLSVGLAADPPANVVAQLIRKEQECGMLRETVSQLELKLEIDTESLSARAREQIKEIEFALRQQIDGLQQEHKTATAGTQEHLLTATRELAELRAEREAAVADKARRDEAEKARAEAKALADRHAGLTRAINSLKAQAAKFVSDSFPGVTVEVDEDGKRKLMVWSSDGSVVARPWDDTNEGRRMEVATQWSVLHQAKRGGAGEAQLALVLLDRGESLDSAGMRRTLDALGSAGQAIVTVRTDGELEFEKS